MAILAGAGVVGCDSCSKDDLDSKPQSGIRIDGSNTYVTGIIDSIVPGHRYYGCSGSGCDMNNPPIEIHTLNYFFTDDAQQHYSFHLDALSVHLGKPIIFQEIGDTVSICQEKKYGIVKGFLNYFQIV